MKKVDKIGAREKVLELNAQGLSNPEIAKKISEEFGETISRETIRSVIAEGSGEMEDAGNVDFYLQRVEDALDWAGRNLPYNERTMTRRFFNKLRDAVQELQDSGGMEKQLQQIRWAYTDLHRLLNGFVDGNMSKDEFKVEYNNWCKNILEFDPDFDELEKYRKWKSKQKN